jgi:hypothetical protein
MKLTIDVDKLVAKTVETSVRGYDKARRAAPAAKKSVFSFKDRVTKAAAKGKKAARRKSK